MGLKVWIQGLTILLILLQLRSTMIGVIAILSAAKGSIWAKYQKFMALDSNDVINKTQ